MGEIIPDQEIKIKTDSGNEDDGDGDGDDGDGTSEGQGGGRRRKKTKEKKSKYSKMKVVKRKLEGKEVVKIKAGRKRRRDRFNKRSCKMNLENIKFVEMGRGKVFKIFTHKSS